MDLCLVRFIKYIDLINVLSAFEIGENILNYLIASPFSEKHLKSA